MIETRASMLLNKGFVKVVVDLTFENINDVDFCQKTSHILCVLSNSLCNSYFFNEFYFEINELELLSKLLSKYNENEDICLNVVTILKWIFTHSGQIKFVKEHLDSFFNCGVLDIINSLVKNNANDSLASMSYNALYYINKSNNI